LIADDETRRWRRRTGEGVEIAAAAADDETVGSFFFVLLLFVGQWPPVNPDWLCSSSIGRPSWLQHYCVLRYVRTSVNFFSHVERRFYLSPGNCTPFHVSQIKWLNTYVCVYIRRDRKGS
jgi:hypothetical protein